MACPARYILYGGARAGGKTETGLGRQLRGAERYGTDWAGLMIRRKYKDFTQIRRRFDSLIAAGLPAERVGGETQMNYVRWRSGATITLAAFNRAEVADDFQGQEYTEITIDEAGTMPYVAGLMDKLKALLRGGRPGMTRSIFLTANPGGSGHMALRDLFIQGHEPYQVWRDGQGETYCYIPSKIYDNAILMDRAPEQVAMLESIRDPALRRAWLEGDWDIFLGQAFPWDKGLHILQAPLPVPETAPLLMTFDWGFAKPFSVGWWWRDADGRLYRFGEWYGWNGTPDEGLRLIDKEIAAGIRQRETEMGIAGRAIIRLADPTCMNRKADYVHGGQAPSTAAVFAEAGLYLRAGNADRRQKIRQFRERMAIPKDANDRASGQLPMLVVYPGCAQFIRTVPALAMDSENPEDIDTEQEDHIYDEACHAVMDRPIQTIADRVSAGMAEAIEAAARERAW